MNELKLKRIPSEPMPAYAALNAYRAMGPHRCLADLAREIGRPLGTLRSWSSRFNWMQRLDDYDFTLIQLEQQMKLEELRAGVADWVKRQAVLRDQEYLAAQQLLQRAREILQNPRVYCKFRDAIECMEIGSRLGRLACNMPLEPQPPRQDGVKYPFDVEALLKRAYPQETRNPPPPGPILTLPAPEAPLPS